MRRVDNPELKRKLLNHLAGLYKIKEIREPNHLSSYIYCRTRSFFDQKQAIEPADEEVMLFAIGYGLQDVLTPKESSANVYLYQGVIYRPDMTLTRGDFESLQELKTTRKSAKNHYIDDFLPATWLAYMKGGCRIRQTNQYDLVILYLMGNYAPPFPSIYADTFYFTGEEIEQNWQTIMSNKKVLDNALKASIPPTPFQHCYEWECKTCRYKLVCETIVRALELPDKQLEEDKKLWQ